MSFVSRAKESFSTMEKYSAWGKSAFKAVPKVGMLALTTSYFHYSYSKDYGYGAAAVYGILTMPPIVGIPAALADAGYSLGNHFYNTQNSKRVSSFSSSKITDNFGTINKMRQHSSLNLSRDHSTAKRMLGNEAIKFHR